VTHVSPKKDTEQLQASRVSKDPYNETPKNLGSAEKEKTVPIIQRRYFGGKVSNQGSIENLDALGEEKEGINAGLQTQPASKNHKPSNILSVIDKIKKEKIESVQDNSTDKLTKTIKAEEGEQCEVVEDESEMGNCDVDEGDIQKNSMVSKNSKASNANSKKSGKDYTPIRFKQKNS
jgi:hypothetical protein